MKPLRSRVLPGFLTPIAFGQQRILSPAGPASQSLADLGWFVLIAFVGRVGGDVVFNRIASDSTQRNFGGACARGYRRRTEVDLLSVGSCFQLSYSRPCTSSA